MTQSKIPTAPKKMASRIPPVHPENMTQDNSQPHTRGGGRGTRGKGGSGRNQGGAGRGRGQRDTAVQDAVMARFMANQGDGADKKQDPKDLYLPKPDQQ